MTWCRTPHGVRGLKSDEVDARLDAGSRTPHGVRGLKWVGLPPVGVHARRTPHGVRGLKSGGSGPQLEYSAVAPRTGCVD